MTHFLIFVALLFMSFPHSAHGMEKSRDAHGEKHAHTVFVAPTDEPYSGAVVEPPTGTGAYVVCVDAANVYGGPDANRMVRYTLPRGTEVNVRERAKWTEEGWAMIKPAYWVSAQDLCEEE